MKLLITTLTMIFISFVALGSVNIPSEKVDEQLCFKALIQGKILSFTSTQYSYTVFWNNNIYTFIAAFSGLQNYDFIIRNCYRIKLN